MCGTQASSIETNCCCRRRSPGRLGPFELQLPCSVGVGEAIVPEVGALQAARPVHVDAVEVDADQEGHRDESTKAIPRVCTPCQYDLDAQSSRDHRNASRREERGGRSPLGSR